MVHTMAAENLTDRRYVYMAKISGPITEPCGTPEVQWTVVELCWPSLTNWCRSSINDFNHFKAMSVTPNSSLNRDNSLPWLMVSNVADMSRLISWLLVFFLSIALYELSNISWSAVSVEWPERYADWSGLKFPVASKCGFNWTSTNLSTSFDTMWRLEIGR